MRLTEYWLFVGLGVVSFTNPSSSRAHDLPATDEPRSHQAPTYRIAEPWTPPPLPIPVAPGQERRLILHLRDGENGGPVSARFTLYLRNDVTGTLTPHVPPALDHHGIRFTSIHAGKKQQETVLYSRGTGPIAIPLPPDARSGSISAVKGYQFVPANQKFTLAEDQPAVEVTLTLSRWSHIAAEGWYPADEHLHYERLNPRHDSDWLTMLAADGLALGNFMVLKGGNLPGVWAQQFAYGKEGTVTALPEGMPAEMPPRDRARVTLVPGEEFRGSLQGHNNLIGLDPIVEPISVGRMGEPATGVNWPATFDVLREARESGGIGGPAHGGTFGKASTAILDAVLGASEFFELANTHLYELEPWYSLLNCGVLLPPAAGTDLPNFPLRESWQPFFGETRMFVRVDGPLDFESWKQNLRRGRVFVTSGPMIAFKVNGAGVGDTVRLPKEGGRVSLSAELSSPYPLSSLEIVCNGRPVEAAVEKNTIAAGVRHWTLTHTVTPQESCWFAARGSGMRKSRLWAEAGVLQHAIAHTAAIPVFVGTKPIFAPEAAQALIAQLREQRAVYETEAQFPSPENRAAMLERFDRAIQRLQVPRSPATGQ